MIINNKLVVVVLSHDDCGEESYTKFLINKDLQYLTELS